MDPLSIAAGAAGLATGCAAIVKTLYTWIDDTVDVDENVSGLCEEVVALSRVLESVSTTTTSTPRIAIAEIDPDETLWLTVKATLGDIRSTLDKLNQLVADIQKSGSVFSRGFLRKPTKQIRFSMRSKDITTYKDRIKSYNAAMTSALQMMNVCLLIHSQSSQDAVFRVLSGLQSQVRHVQVALHVGNGATDGSAETREEAARISRNLQQMVRVAESIQSSASTIVGDGARSTVYGGSIMGEPLTEEQVSSIQGWIPPPIAEEDESTSNRYPVQANDQANRGQNSDSEDDVDRDLVRRLQELAVTNMTKGDYPQAETFFRRAVERGESNQTPTTEILKMRLGLADACIYQEKWSEAEDIISPIAWERKVADVPVFHAMHAFAIMHVKNGDLKAADKCCKRALWGKRKVYGRAHPSCWETLELLASICDARDDEPEAEAHRSFVPSTFQPVKDLDALAYIKRIGAEGLLELEPPLRGSQVSESASSSQVTISSPPPPTATLSPLSQSLPTQSYSPQRPRSAQQLQQLQQPQPAPVQGTRSQSISPLPVSYRHHPPPQPPPQHLMQYGGLQPAPLFQRGSAPQNPISMFDRANTAVRREFTPHRKADLIIGVHFGVTHTTVAYAFATHNEAKESLITTWPGTTALPRPAIPTVLYYDQKKVIGWGHDNANLLGPTGYLKPDVLKVEWFTLGLMLEPGTYIDDISLPPLPEDMGSIDVCTDFLSRVRGAIENALDESLGGVYSREKNHVKWYFSVPAAWGDVGKGALRRSIILAGFFQAESDAHERLRLVTEPEASVHHCSKTGLLSTGKGGVVLIADCGAGTVDLVACEVTRESPLELQQCTTATGDSCGSTALNSNFSSIARGRIRKMRLPDTTKTARRVFAKCMMDFDNRIKADFRNNGQKWAVDIGIEADFPDAGIEEGFMVFTNEEILACFEPVVNRIRELVRNQILAVHNQQRNLQNVLITGTFGENEYLFQQIKEYIPPGFHHRLVRPMDPATCVAKGIVSAGIARRSPASRDNDKPYVAKSTILVQDTRRWQESDPTDMIRLLPDGQNYVTCTTAPIIAAGNVLETGQAVVRPMTWFYQSYGDDDITSLRFSIGIFRWTAEAAPQMLTTDPRCQTVAVVEVDLTQQDPDRAFRKFYLTYAPYYLIEYSLRFTITGRFLEVQAMFLNEAVSKRVEILLD